MMKQRPERCDWLRPSGRRILAFTLVELMVELSIIAVMVALLLPILGRSREAAFGIQCLSNLRQVGLASYVYQEDYRVMPAPWSSDRWRNEGGAISSFSDLMVRFTDYLPRSGPDTGTGNRAHSPALQCPGDPSPPTSDTGRNRYWRSYTYRMGMAGRGIAEPGHQTFASDLWQGAYNQNYPKPILFDASSPAGEHARYSFSTTDTAYRGSATLGGAVGLSIGSDAPERWTLDTPWHEDGVNVFFHDGRAGRVGFGRQLGEGPGT